MVHPVVSRVYFVILLCWDKFSLNGWSGTLFSYVSVLCAITWLERVFGAGHRLFMLRTRWLGIEEWETGIPSFLIVWLVVHEGAGFVDKSLSSRCHRIHPHSHWYVDVFGACSPVREQKAQITMARGTTTGKVDSARTGTDPKLWESKENGSLVVWKYRAALWTSGEFLTCDP